MDELERLREATHVRLSAATVEGLRLVAESYTACGDKEDRILGQGLGLLLDMHDKLEAIRHGQT